MRTADDGRVVHPTARSVAQFLDEWFAGVQPTLDATTWQNWKDYARLYVAPRIGGERLQQLDEPQLLKLYGALLSEGRIKPDHDSVMYAYWAKRTAEGEPPTPKDVSESCGTTIHAARAAVRRYKSGIVPKRRSPGLAPKTVRNIHTMIHRALADAVAWKYISDNPASNIKPPKKPRSRRPVWNAQQIQTFLKSIQDDRFAALFLLELTTGVRRGQICGLKWADVDLNAALITVHDNRVVVAGRAVDKAGGKTVNADQTIAIDRATVAALRQWRIHQDGERTFFGRDYKTGDYVFTFEDGRPPHPDSIRQRFDRLAASAGLARITFHDLRHSYATGALKAGINPKVVSERIGHSDVGYFLQTYAHVSLDDDREAAEKAAGFVIGDAWQSGASDPQ
ncbi:site-specific integrase [Mycobacterium sp. CBMA293]|nr:MULTISPECIES: site-specific integrase [unclassified Mycolicibacterium]MUL57281.1 site-specific integrase [Mycolicibacterium sp. CBMA 335]MUL70321.1 site-specific integrase [Mycolicibacterium sp. CBMA 311]MUM06790.1 site-specific integrase [Mycolicibacterium sp. CBMA 213]MUM12548.1 site-specific integrase [Mycolicibacterium sp. CBMA 293]MUL46932.1 site-specific integrase [Mycolicibacterium sp. CBMA 360]